MNVTITTNATGARWNYCPDCGQKLEAAWKHCPGCGREIGSFAAPWTHYPVTYPVYPNTTPLYPFVTPTSPWPGHWPTITCGGGLSGYTGPAATGVYTMRGDEQISFTS